ncbi:MAG: porphobilinogen synthase [Bacteroidetes bacterium]|nr:MAG: porphobilinogen synthase [Bacteroidota bacterium]
MIPPTAPIASLIHRPRRLRRTDALRRMVRETRLSPDRLIAPLFVVDGRDVCQPIPSMPDQFRLSIDRLVQECRELAALGIPAVALFPKIDEALKTPDGRESLNPDGLFPRAIRAVKDAVPDLMVVTDVALDPYSSQGHDGLVRGGQIVNDETLAILAEMAVVQARAGADVIAPSDMMDGRVAAIRHALDEEGFTNTAILAYTAKYASAFYGPFRDALDSAPRAEADVPADKQTYQMDPANAREALRELMLDLDEGADMVMVKPAVPYLDIIRRFKDAADVPVAAYHVSGEYAMIKAAARNGWLDEAAAMTETLTAIHRAGADVILTYFARTFAERF